MRLIITLVVGGLFVACLVGSLWEEPVRAVKVVERSTDGTAIARSGDRPGPGGIEGEVLFLQAPCPGCPTPAPGAPAAHFRNFPEPGVLIVARINGPTSALAPGAHGVHIHEVGLCLAPFASAGSHLDLGPAGNNLPCRCEPSLSHGRCSQPHRQLTRAWFPFPHFSRITLSPGPLSIFDADGSAVIVHLNPDSGQPGVSIASGGARIACGVIQPVTDDDDDFDIGH